MPAALRDCRQSVADRSLRIAGDRALSPLDLAERTFSQFRIERLGGEDAAASQGTSDHGGEAQIAPLRQRKCASGSDTNISYRK